MNKFRITAILIILLGFGIGYFAYQNENSPYKLGLDLNGGTHLVYQADISELAPEDVDSSMEALRDTIENRINVLGVAEPLIQTQVAQVGGDKVHKLIVELPGVTDIDKAIEIIGQTPILEFKTATTSSVGTSTAVGFISTGLTGRLLSRATLQFDSQTQSPIVGLQFNDEGKELFAKITQENVGNVIAIFLDGRVISAPVVNESILNGEAVISGGFTAAEARDLVQNLNYGALPVPVSLIGSQTVGASLGIDALNRSMFAGLIGLVIIMVFLIVWYRLPGVIAAVSLLFYVALNLAIFKLIPVTLTSTGLAAFILSIGMAVDANILIFERMKEEINKGLSMEQAIREGFNRAWTSIRDGNLSSIITAVILFWFATSALIKGFALVFVIGVLISMFTAITVSRTLLLAIAPKHYSFLFGHGLKK